MSLDSVLDAYQMRDERTWLNHKFCSRTENRKVVKKSFLLHTVYSTLCSLNSMYRSYLNSAHFTLYVKNFRRILTIFTDQEFTLWMLVLINVLHRYQWKIRVSNCLGGLSNDLLSSINGLTFLTIIYMSCLKFESNCSKYEAKVMKRTK